MTNSKAIMSAEQVDRLRPLEGKLAKFTFSPRNIGYLGPADREVLTAVYREITNTKAPCGSCESTWICKMNVWYQASKEKWDSAKTGGGQVGRGRRTRKTTKKTDDGSGIV